MWAIQSKGGQWVYRKPELDEVRWGLSRHEAMIFPTESKAKLFMTINNMPNRYRVVEVRMEVIEHEDMGT